ncbi:YadA-like family protein, partial [Ursidibacter arcticus]
QGPQGPKGEDGAPGGAGDVQPGKNITVDTKDNLDGSKTFTVHGKDTTVSSGSDKVVVTPTPNTETGVTDYKVDLSQDTKDKIDGGFGLKDQNGNEIKQDLNTAIAVVGKGPSLSTSVITDTDGAKKLQVALTNNVQVGEKGEPGQNGKPGKDGIDGSVGVNGKDGSSVVLNGKDGSIGLTGPKGADGKDGASANIKVVDGPVGVDGKGSDGKDGTTKTRIEYQPVDGNGTPIGEPEKVATLKDGLKFQGNDGKVIAKELNQTLDIVGGIKDADLATKPVSDKNTRVENVNGSLVVKFADRPEFSEINLTNNGNVSLATDAAKPNTLVLGGKKDENGNNAPVTVSNVNSGLNVYGDDKADVGGLLDLSEVTNQDGELNPSIANNVATVGDLANLGWVVGAPESGYSEQIRNANTVNFVGDNDAVTVNGATTEDGAAIIEIHVDSDKVAQNIAGNISNADNKAVNQSPTHIVVKDGNPVNVIQVGDKYYNVADFENGKPKADATPVTPDSNTAVTQAPPRFATTVDVANVINNSGWTATIGRDDKDFTDQAGKDKPSVINPGDTVSFNAGKNLKVKQDGENVTFALKDAIEVNKVEVGAKGKDGKDGIDGSVGVNGKDGSSVVLNGKDGSIGLTGPKGADGKDGASANIKVVDGPAGVDGKGSDGKDGTTKTRIEYQPVDGNGTPIGEPEKVATLKDGLKFQGNDGKVIAKELNQTLDIVGGIKDADLATKPVSDKNTRVENVNGSLVVKFADRPEFSEINLTNNGNNVSLATDAAKPNTLVLSGKKDENGNNAPVTVSNVASNLPETVNTGDIKADGSKADAPTKSQAAPSNVNDIKNNAATVSDVLNAGFNLQGNGIGVDFVKPYDTVNFIDGAGTTVVAKSEDGKTSTVQVNVDAKKLTGNVTIEGNKAADKTPTHIITKDNKPVEVIKVGDNYYNPTDIANGQPKADATPVTPDAGSSVVSVTPRFTTTTDVVNAINGSGFTLKTSATAEGEKDKSSTGDEVINPGKTVEMIAGKNLAVKQDTDGKVTFALKDEIEVNKVEVGAKGKDGKDGIDGSVGVNGKDGSSVVLNGKDGSIGLTGPKGADGKDGKSANISVKDGQAGLDGAKGQDGKDGTEGKTRIVYETKDPNDPTKTVTEEVATLKDGLRFDGDSGEEVKRPLNSKLSVKGGQTDKTKLSDNPNIGVVTDPANGTLNVKLAKDVDLGNDGSVTTGNTTINNNGLTIKEGPSVTKEGINAGNKVISNVAPGVKGTDAVNVNQLNAVNKKVDNLDKRVRGVGASSAAAASLPQVYIPGKSMVAAAAGGYAGASAVSVGYSRASDNGKVILKLQGTANSQGHLSGGVGVGYQW